MSEHLMDVQVRFADSDAMGHLNNAALVTYFEIGRMSFFAPFPEFWASAILAQIAVDYRRQVRLTDHVRVRTLVSRVGTSSVGLRQEILAEGQVAVDCTSVVVHFDYASQRSAPIPDGVRAVLEGLVEADA